MGNKKKNKQKISQRDRIELKKIAPIVKEIECFREEMMNLPERDLRLRTAKLRHKLRTGETLDDILPEAYALVREASRRILGKEHYKVQLIGGVLLHQGRIAELKTGEGKTILAILPAYLNALDGKGVHVVTVNEYLAKRDSDEVREVFEFLGMTVGCVSASMKPKQRQLEYSKDITYVTNSEVGFDYLRDNLVKHSSQRVLRGLHYAIIDEVDSVLIDDAKTPLIISTAKEENNALYIAADKLAKGMVETDAEHLENGHFVLDEKDKIVTLTDKGIEKVEKFFGIKNISARENLDLFHHVMNAMYANYLNKKDVSYIVKSGKVHIIDVSTGRIMEGRRFSDGLHQALEAKEGVEIKQAMRTQATITYQSFFNKYTKKSGMTGTGKIEEKEFNEVYYLDVVQVPTNRPVIREDKEDLIFETNYRKIKAICYETEQSYKKGQPVLIGTSNVGMSEEISKELAKRGLPHKVLNAKNDIFEAQIIAAAGQVKAITVATNMAGRGTDIKLSDEAKALGGLRVIGSERHKSRRIDDQLRGRSGRQGDPGESQFFLSIEDDLIKYYASEEWLAKLNKQFPFNLSLSGKKITKEVRNSQSIVELNDFASRSMVLAYDETNNLHREFFYKERNFLLDNLSADELLNNYIAIYSEVTFDEEVTKYFLVHDAEIKRRLRLNLDMLPTSQRNRIVRQAILEALDKEWINHLERLDYLKQWISCQSYGQKDPRLEYRKKAQELLVEFKCNVAKNIAENLIVR